MKTICATAITALFFSAVALPAFAEGDQDMTSQHQYACNDMLTQFDQAAPGQKGSPNYKRAMTLRKRAGNQCSNFHYNKGIATIRDALNAIGQHPAD